MTWNVAYETLLTRFANRFPLPQRQEGESIETFFDRCRDWMRRLGEQFGYTFGPGWGRKAADRNRPWSKDTLAYRNVLVFVGWDVMLGTSSGYPTLSPHEPQWWNLAESGQFFGELPAINHLWDVVPPVPPPEPPPEPDLNLVARVEQIEAFLFRFFKAW